MKSSPNNHILIPPEPVDFDPTTTPTGTYKAGKKRDDNLARILDAAEEIFVARGFKGASIQSIADAAGLPKANIHYYYKNKTTLYQSVLSKLINLWNTQFNEIKAEDDPATALDGFIREKVRISFTHPNTSKLFAMEVISGAPNLQVYMRTDLRRWVKDRAHVIQSWIEQDKMPATDPVQLIFLIWSSTQHYADFETQVLSIMNKSRYDARTQKKAADFLSDTILRGCGLRPLSAKT
ncbi:MAG: TetR/AcrR family transcriptional regulator [Pseudomonadota bacterium]